MREKKNGRYLLYDLRTNSTELKQNSSLKKIGCFKLANSELRKWELHSTKQKENEKGVNETKIGKLIHGAVLFKQRRATKSILEM
jgi:hypothetical protein